MARTHRSTPPKKGVSEKARQLKRQNLWLRGLNKRYRRDLKNLRGILINVQRALGNGDLLRAIALIPEKIKHPPSEVTECRHEFQYKYVYVNKCKHCGEMENVETE